MPVPWGVATSWAGVDTRRWAGWLAARPSAAWLALIGDEFAATARYVRSRAMLAAEALDVMSMCASIDRICRSLWLLKMLGVMCVARSRWP